MYERIRKHGEDLLRIFPNATEQDLVLLCKRLRGLEIQGERIATALCNGDIQDEDYETSEEVLLEKVNLLLGNLSGAVPVFLNGDPRGYALKIRDEYVCKHNLEIHRDWGGYGILAPDLSE